MLQQSDPQGRRRRRLLVLALVAGAAVAAGLPAASLAGGAVEFGRTVTLSGTVPGAAAGERVDIMALPYGAEEYAHAGTVTTRAGGRWRWTGRPRIRTTYRAVWNSVPTATVVVRVAPDLDLSFMQGAFVARARAASSLAGHRVTLQLRRPGTSRWRPLRTLVLDRGSRAAARLSLPAGRSYLRLSMTRAEAGPGYDAARSAVLTFTRKT